MNLCIIDHILIFLILAVYVFMYVWLSAVCVRGCVWHLSFFHDSPITLVVLRVEYTANEPKTTKTTKKGRKQQKFLWNHLRPYENFFFFTWVVIYIGKQQQFSCNWDFGLISCRRCTIDFIIASPGILIAKIKEKKVDFSTKFYLKFIFKDSNWKSEYIKSVDIVLRSTSIAVHYQLHCLFIRCV